MNFAMPWTSSKPQANAWTAPIEDMKQQIGQQVDHLAQVAAQVGRDVASQAAQITNQAAQVTTDAASQAAVAARDLSGQAVKQTQGATTQAVVAAREAPSAAGGFAQQLMRSAAQGAAQIGRDLRTVRVTREPRVQPQGPDFMPGVALLAGFGGGLALMYFFDRGEGRRRRALLRDQLTKWTRIGRETATGKAKDVRNRTVGVMYEARKAVAGKPEGEPNEMDAVATGSRTNGYGFEEPDTERIDQPVPSEIS